MIAHPFWKSRGKVEHLYHLLETILAPARNLVIMLERRLRCHIIHIIWMTYWRRWGFRTLKRIACGSINTYRKSLGRATSSQKRYGRFSNPSFRTGPGARTLSGSCARNGMRVIGTPKAYEAHG